LQFAADEREMPPAYARQQERAEAEERRIADSVTDAELAAWLSEHPQALAECYHFDNVRLAELQTEAWMLFKRGQPEAYAETAAALCEIMRSGGRHAESLAEARRKLAAWKRVRG
jgi:hypothetical protein